MPSFRIYPVDSGGEVLVEPRRLIVAGYTGRDTDAVQAHIDELAAIGIPPPPSVPTFYDLDPTLVTTAPTIEVTGDHTSGEAEPILIRHDDCFYLGIGSDHTDRALERTDIARSKAACDKPVADRVITLPDELATVDWDHIRLESTVDGVSYQSGTLAALRTPEDLLGRLAEALGEITGDFVLFGGTLPLLTGDFRHGTQWQLALTAGDMTVTCSYDTKRRNA